MRVIHRDMTEEAQPSAHESVDVLPLCLSPSLSHTHTSTENNVTDISA